MRALVGVVAVLVLCELARAQQSKPATNPSVDLSTPRGALRALNQALRAGDVAHIKRLFIITTPSEAKMVEADARMSAAFAHLHEAAVKAFGAESAKAITGDTAADDSESTARIDGADITVAGDTATVTYKDQKQPPFVLKKVDGEWKVPMADWGKPIEPADLKQRLTELAVQRKLVEQITSEIEQGKFATAKEARQAWQSRMLEAATSQPSSRPAGQADSDE